MIWRSLSLFSQVHQIGQLVAPIQGHFRSAHHHHRNAVAALALVIIVAPTAQTIAFLSTSHS